MNKLINFAALLVCVGASVSASARNITLEDRLAAQKAIEQVYWNHRVWPKENLGAKPPLSAVMPDSAIRAKVEDYLAKSNALEHWWRRPITAEQLQAELSRMTRDTQDGALLNELYQALGNDPGLITETLARQTLAERLIHNWYGSDTRFHADTRAMAEAARAACDRVSCLKALSGEYSETTWVRSDDRTQRLPDPRQTAIALGSADWDRRLNRLAMSLDAKRGSPLAGRVGALEETDEGFGVTAVLAQGDGELTAATVVWPKRSFDAWWDAERGAVGSRIAQPPGTFTLSAAPSSVCTNDTWSRTRYQAPDARMRHTAVWTGSEMIVWGGNGENGYSNYQTGGRYNPSTDVWTPISTGPNVPPESYYDTVVWTGREMIIWGGGPSNTGARYNPATDT
jgi:hypothetical protein